MPSELDKCLDALCAGESSSDLRAILSCSYQNLSQPAARMFRLLGLHPGPDISASDDRFRTCSESSRR